jgi:hypothetical protein
MSIQDRNGKDLLVVESISVLPDLLEALTGEFMVNALRLKGMQLDLTKDKNGLNIDFIIDAFRSEQKPAESQPNPFEIGLKRIVLQDIIFNYNNFEDSTRLHTNLGDFDARNFYLGINPILLNCPRSFWSIQISVLFTPNNLITTSPNHYLLLI